jgi:CubicO group peptidase (beta-lactamase class C family)
MQTRIGSIAIPYLIDVLFQLRDAGRLSLDDPLSKYFPTVEDLVGRELLEGIAVEVVE